MVWKPIRIPRKWRSTRTLRSESKYINPLLYFDPEGLVSRRNHKLDPAQVEEIKERLKDPTLDKKTRNELKNKLKRHEKATGERHSRESKDKKKGKGKSVKSLNPYLMSMGIACALGSSPCGICDLLGFPNPTCDNLCI
jgi:hypothetical protein